MASLGEAVVDVGANTAGFRSDVERGVESALGRSAKSMQNAGRKMSSVGRSMTMGVTAPIVGVGVAAVKTAGQFESSMNILQAATGNSDKAMQALKDQAIDLGASSVFSANEAADAMLELGRAGFNASQISKAVPEVMSLAATEGIALAEAAGVVTSSLAQFGLQAGDSGQVVNALAGASNASRSSVATLGQSMKLVGSAASGIGLSVQETAGALAALSQAGLDGSIAGTSLAGVFNRLVPTTTKARDVMQGLGLDFTNAKGQFDSIDVIAEKLRGSFGNMSEEARKVKIGAIFGRDASTIAAVNALISEGGDGLRGYTKAANDQSAAQRLAEARMKGVQGAVEKMKGALETAGLVIGQAMIPMVTKVADKIGFLAEKFSGLGPDTQKMVLVFGLIAAAAGPVLVVAGMLITAVGTVAGAFAALSVAVAAPAIAIGIIVGALALLLWKSEAARAVVVGAFEQIKAAILPAVAQISGMLTGTLIPAFMKIWPVIEKVGVVILSIFAGAVVGVIKGFVNIIVGVFNIIVGAVKVFTSVLKGDWKGAWEGVKQIFTGALRAIWGALQVWMNVGLLGVFRRGFGVLKGLISGGLTFIKTIFSRGMGYVTGTIRGAWETVRGATSSAWAAIRNGVSSAINGVRTTVTNGFNAVVNFVRGIPGKIMGMVSSFLSAGRSLGSSIIGGLMDGLRAAGGLVSDLGSSIKSAINGALNLPFTINGPGPLPDFTIPAFAQGGVAPGGMALVGERGPELVNLPRGSRVHSNADSQRMAQSSRMPSKVILRIGARDFVAYVEEIADDRIDAADSLAYQGA